MGGNRDYSEVEFPVDPLVGSMTVTPRKRYLEFP
jgi:hypothetical protein